MSKKKDKYYAGKVRDFPDRFELSVKVKMGCLRKESIQLKTIMKDGLSDEELVKLQALVSAT